MNTTKKRKSVSPKQRVVCFNILEDRCIWMKAGVINFRICDNAFDQMLDEVDLAADLGTPVYKEVSGFKVADDYYYHMGHSWARFEHGGRVRIGLDDFAVPDSGSWFQSCSTVLRRHRVPAGIA